MSARAAGASTRITYRSSSRSSNIILTSRSSAIIGSHSSPSRPAHSGCKERQEVSPRSTAGATRGSGQLSRQAVPVASSNLCNQVVRAARGLEHAVARDVGRADAPIRDYLRINRRDLLQELTTGCADAPEGRSLDIQPHQRCHRVQALGRRGSRVLFSGSPVGLRLGAGVLQQQRQHAEAARRRIDERAVSDCCVKGSVSLSQRSAVGVARGRSGGLDNCPCTDETHLSSSVAGSSPALVAAAAARSTRAISSLASFLVSASMFAVVSTLWGERGRQREQQHE